MLRRVLLAAFALAAVAGLTAAPASAQPSDVTRLAIIGDSLTTGYGVPAGQGYADLLEADAAGDNVLPLARDGWTARRWMTVSLPELEQLADWQPTTVLIALGGNDWYIGRRTEDWQTDLTYLTWHIRSKVPTARVIYLRYYPIGIAQDTRVCDVWPCTPRSSAQSTFSTAMRDAAIRNYAGYIDLGLYAPDGRPWSYHLGTDRVHLTSQGHALFHQAVRARLIACC